MHADHTELRELDTRITDGIHVRLLWSAPSDRVLVDVDDAKTGERFSIEVGRDERALDVFHHPFSYAAWRRIAPRAVPALAGT